MEPSITFNASEESPPLPFPSRQTDHSLNHHHHDTDRFSDFNQNRDRFAEGNRNEGSSSRSSDDSSSCFFFVSAFSIFVALTVSFGWYGTETLRLGPNSSILIKPNNLLVASVKVEETDAAQGPIIYGFHKDPPLDVDTAWSEIHEITIPANFHKEWMYYLNEGSGINISYSVISPSRSPLVLVIAQGDEDLAEWLMDPSYPKTTLSYNIIHGNGSIQKKLSRSSYYYVAVGNLNNEYAEVYLNIRIKALLYNTAEPYYKCIPALGQCHFQLQLLGKNVAVITSPGGKSGTEGGGWHVKLSYGPRWLTYVVGIGGLLCLVLLTNSLCNYWRRNERVTQVEQFGASGSERNPLLSNKDGNLSSEDSSYASPSEDEERIEGSHDGKTIKDDEYSQRLCAICFDSPKDSFFLPCGHSVACFPCGERIMEASGTCPICRRRAKKVRKIYTV